MKKIKDLAPEDFSININPEQFQEWKDSRLLADKIGLWMFLIFLFPGGLLWNEIAPDLYKNLFWLFFIGIFFAWYKPNQLAKKIGINGKLMDDARDDMKIKDYPGIDSTTFQRWRKSVLIRNTWIGLAIIILATVITVVLFSPLPKIVTFSLLLISLSGLLVLIIRPFMLKRKLDIKK
jgi:hypothetical protein